MKTNYELLVILNYEISEEEIETKAAMIKQIIDKRGGEVTEVNKWGKRRLAYDIKKTKKGYYLLIYFMVEADLVIEIDQDLKFVEGINRFLIVKAPINRTFFITGAELEMQEEAAYNDRSE